MATGKTAAVFHDAVTKGLELWAARGFEITTQQIQENLTGGNPLNVDTGRLRKSIRLISRPWVTVGDAVGFSVGTNVSYGIAWEKGFTRKGYTIFPKKGKTLAWTPKDTSKLANSPKKREGKIVARSVKIPPKHFGARPFISKALAEKEKELHTLLGQSIVDAFDMLDPTLVVDVKLY